MLYAPYFSHTPLYGPHIRNNDTILIVIDGNQVRLLYILFLLWKCVFEIFSWKLNFSLQNVLSWLTCHWSIWYQSYISFSVFWRPQVTSDTIMLFKTREISFRPDKNWVIGEKIFIVTNEWDKKCVQTKHGCIINTFNDYKRVVCCQWGRCWALIP